MAKQQIAAEVASVIKEAQRGIRSIWIVCPSSSQGECRSMIIGCSPAEAVHEDGVSYLPGGSEVRLATLDAPPKVGEYEVYFLEGGGDLSPDEVQNRRIWRKNAVHVLNNTENVT